MWQDGTGVHPARPSSATQLFNDSRWCSEAAHLVRGRIRARARARVRVRVRVRVRARVRARVRVRVPTTCRSMIMLGRAEPTRKTWGDNQVTARKTRPCFRLGRARPCFRRGLAFA